MATKSSCGRYPGSFSSTALVSTRVWLVPSTSVRPSGSCARHLARADRARRAGLVFDHHRPLQIFLISPAISRAIASVGPPAG